MLDVMNGLMNTMNGLDVAAKMGYKATHGGTIGRAKLGYLNAKKEVEGKQIATVILDPKRAPLVRRAWELYATGDYSIDRLEATLADMGLTSRASSRHPHEHPVSANKVHQMFADPYYLGYIVYKGDLYRGNHEPLVDEALFQKVQAVRDLRSAKGQRDRIHQHYLKGGLFCQRCHKQGRDARLIFTQHTGRAGKKYSYFVCRGRQDGLCDLPHLRVEAVEDAVVEHYHTLKLPTTFIDDVRTGLDEALADQQGATKELHASLSRRLRDLDLQENRLVDALADGTLPGDKIRAKLRDLRLQKDRIKLGLADTSEQLAVGASVLRNSLHLLADPQRVYAEGGNTVRRLLNQTFYERFYVDEIADTTVPDDEKTPLFEELHEANRTHRQRTTSGEGITTATRRAVHAPQKANDGQAGTGPDIADHRHIGTGHDKSPRDAEAPASTDAESSSAAFTEPSLADVLSVNDSSTALMVELRGIEPLTFSMRTRRATNCAIAPCGSLPNHAGEL